MNWVDLGVLAVLGLSGLLAFLRGFVREALGLAAWVAAGLAASPYGAFPYVQPFVHQHIEDVTAANIVAYAGVFVPVLIVMWMLAGGLSELVRGSMLGGLDRTLGLAFGLARGAALLSVAYVMAGIVFRVDQWPAPVTEARSLPLIHQGAEWIASQIPATSSFHPTVVAPPGGRPTSSASLLQSKPDGRAISARAPRD